MVLSPSSTLGEIINSPGLSQLTKLAPNGNKLVMLAWLLHVGQNCNQWVRTVFQHNGDGDGDGYGYGNGGGNSD